MMPRSLLRLSHLCSMTHLRFDDTRNIERCMIVNEISIIVEVMGLLVVQRRQLKPQPTAQWRGSVARAADRAQLAHCGRVTYRQRMRHQCHKTSRRLSFDGGEVITSSGETLRVIRRSRPFLKILKGREFVGPSLDTISLTAERHDSRR